MLKIGLDQLVDGMKDATLNYWFSEEGDTVREGDDLVELLVDGNAVKMTVPRTGILTEVYFTEGDAVSVGDILCDIDENGRE